ncbi:hypothetical protein ACET3X_000336 [Alternaria dauci]|uniref:Extracellular mutant protein 11 C-terminal domain-containing protein n=1 Tax=Alternaria dauci TaxID=48095 RepID=A0ABR3UVY7_9PLEO
MQGFVRGRTGSPSNAQPQGKPDRQANAASARIPVKNGHPRLQSQAPSDVPAREYVNARNSSAALQQTSQHRQPGLGPGKKRDLYDTDAESIDTTVNQSVVQVEDSQQKEQYHQQQGQVEGDEESEEDEDEDDDEADGDGEEADEPEDQYHYPGHELTPDDGDYLQRASLGHFPHAEKISFLQTADNRGLPTVDGDSYPSTTNGELSEWGIGQEAASNFHDGRAPVSQRQNANNQAVRMAALQHRPQQQSQNDQIPSHNMHPPSKVIQHSAQLREQSRAAAPALQQRGQSIQQSIPAPFASHHQTHSRKEPYTTDSQPVYSNHHHSAYAQPGTSQQKPPRQASIPRTQIPLKQNIIWTKPPAPTRLPPPLPAIQEPVVQEQTIEQAQVDETETVPPEDYDLKTLLKKKYEELKKEPFDVDPRAPPLVLAEEEGQKPLVERLPFVQKNLHKDQQTQFFRSLPTTEWEDAGDWFLDKFQDIVQRTKEARQKKRKLAQEFEAEVEKRYEHVSKKQHQVQEAMEKMKEQGEGLMPRSPRPSKSPRSRRG